MLPKLLLILLLVPALRAVAQLPVPPPPPPAARRANDLVHTRLAVRFDYARRYLYGEEWVTLRPPAAATDSLRLDAKGMDIAAVELVRGTGTVPLRYAYDQRQLRIGLGRLVPVGETYTVYVRYTARPDELHAQAGTAIRGAKGLYFINPDSAVRGKPVQVWTQGEPDASSAWFPTIDDPAQKTTQELSLTVPSRYVTLSNGRLLRQVPAGPGLRTDTWRQDEPHAPYLVMLAVGDFRITTDTWRGKEVSYYLEPRYAAQARSIFGKTPRMLEYFSQRFGVEYPWDKYSQVVCRDYVAGAMENTTASLFGEHAQGSAREQLDWPYALVEREIAHELCHHWFGDYVTPATWANLTLSESFANFSEVLWAEHEYGPDAGAQQAERSLSTYLRTPANFTKPVLRPHYVTKDELFDAVVYQKGGSILNMLRAQLGEEVFFRGLQGYLRQQAFGTAEVAQLQQALEQASGQRLDWFFAQWFAGTGHPVVRIDYQWQARRRRQAVVLRQTQAGALFVLPLTVDVYVGGHVQHYPVTLRHAVDTLYFPAATRPDLVNVDAAKVLVWQKDDRKTLSEFAYQYRHAGRYLDRREALQAARAQAADPLARQLLLAGLADPAAGLRELTIGLLDLKNAALRTAARPLLARLATADTVPAVQAAALAALGSLRDRQYAPVFVRALASPSYRVQGAALEALLPLDPARALSQATAFEADHKGALTAAMVLVYGQAGNATHWPLVRAKFDAADPGGRFGMLPGMGELLGRLPDLAALTEGITRIRDLTVEFKAYVNPQGIIGLLRQVQAQQAAQPYAPQARAVIDQAVAAIEAAK